MTPTGRRLDFPSLPHKKAPPGAWPAFERKLAETLDALEEDQYLVVSAKRGWAYVQFRRAGVVRAARRAEDLIRLKRETQTTLSYAGLVKRATRLGFAHGNGLENTHWKKLEEQIYGEPAYKRIQRARKARAARAHSLRGPG